MVTGPRFPRLTGILIGAAASVVALLVFRPKKTPASTAATPGAGSTPATPPSSEGETPIVPPPDVPERYGTEELPDITNQQLYQVLAELKYDVDLGAFTAKPGQDAIDFAARFADELDAQGYTQTAQKLRATIAQAINLPLPERPAA